MKDEFEALDNAAKAIVLRIVGACSEDGRSHSITLADGRQVYCYRHAGDQIAWGINGGPKFINLARGVMTRTKTGGR